MKFKANLILILFAGSFLISSCGQKSSDSNDSKSENQIEGEVKIDGSSTVYPITEAVAEEFRAEQPDIQVTVGVSGTGGGFKKFCRGEIDINDASRPIKDKEKTACSGENIDFVELTVAYDGLAVVINPENDWVDHFTVEELKKIWEPAAQGAITKWSQIRPEWPDEEFSLYGPGVASGTYDYFTEAIVGESGASRGDYTASEDDNVLVQGIAGDKNAIGFFGLAYFEENQDKLKLIAVKHEGEPVLPSLETVKSGEYAPLSRPIFIYINRGAADRPAVKAFVDFYLEVAPELVQDVGYIPLPNEEYQKEKSEFESFVQTAKQ
ncbi:PstS family phosphate ABC transporter substrate-binding protein [Fulvivirga sp. 29W222]|uniref:Phosphate-binding protein n=1 Tax=Fulvivirga marina TaxID=2494733 RepID=A0A937G3M1_9BACT|nr:PstS family phosphate ABC transporter substrate-binding protein [Fulvivirga marina]MBL6449676.1 PstS family phosphate ABC transporter substrate-binding protein [Fulvivirga marina]